MQRLAQSPAPIRVGQPPKALLLYRTAEPFTKRVRKFVLAGEDPEIVYDRDILEWFMGFWIVDVQRKQRDGMWAVHNTSRLRETRVPPTPTTLPNHRRVPDGGL